MYLVICKSKVTGITIDGCFEGKKRAESYAEMMNDIKVTSKKILRNYHLALSTLGANKRR